MAPAPKLLSSEYVFSRHNSVISIFALNHDSDTMRGIRLSLVEFNSLIKQMEGSENCSSGMHERTVKGYLDGVLMVAAFDNRAKHGWLFSANAGRK